MPTAEKIDLSIPTSHVMVREGAPTMSLFVVAKDVDADLRRHGRAAWPESPFQERLVLLEAIHQTDRPNVTCCRLVPFLSVPDS
jgi:hypothetical protein